MKQFARDPFRSDVFDRLAAGVRYVPTDFADDAGEDRVGETLDELDAIRGTAKLNAEIEEGYKSTLMCHLGNIAWRTGRTIDPAAPKPKDVEALWSREYRAGWEPKV